MPRSLYELFKLTSADAAQNPAFMRLAAKSML